MGPITSFARVLGARAAAVALAVPMLLGGAVPASAAIVSHAMAPALGSHARYQLIGKQDPSGLVRFSCQRPAATFPCIGPDQVRTAYEIQPVLNQGITGAGRTIVIIDAFQSPTIRQDLALFDLVWGIPNPTFNIIAPDGLTPFDPTDGNQVGWSAEISLDVQWAHAIAPGATIDLVLAKSNNDADILSATRFAVDHNLGDVISQSFGEAEACMDPKLLKEQHRLFSRATAKGITLFASSGDQGSAQPTCDGASFMKSASTPASEPLVTGVGGTRLTADRNPDLHATGAYQSESVWNDVFGASGGGFSNVYKRPGYQEEALKGIRQRGVPDVAYNGDVFGGVIVAWGVPFGLGTFFIFGGTSAGSPQWSGIVALGDQMGHHRLGAINSALYEIAQSEDGHADAFHDITVGNNGCTIDVCGISVPGFSATPGWDAATGLGTPRVANLLGLLVEREGHDNGGQEDAGN